MKLNQLIGLTMATLFATGISAAPGGHRGVSIELVVDRLFEKLDSDQSDTISFDEFVTPKLEKAEEKFAALDSDGDELLTFDEILAGHTPPQDPIDRDAMRECLEDKLGIDLPEHMTAEEKFAAADTNGDGYLDWSEYSAGKIAGVEVKFAHIDSSADGEVDKAELTEALESRKPVRIARKECREELGTLNDLIADE